VRPLLAQRLLALLAASLLAGVAGVAVAAQRDDPGAGAPTIPQPAIADRDEWYRALAGVRSERAMDCRRSACGQPMRTAARGVTHPVLPCGAKVYVVYRDNVALTQVIDRGPFGAGREFDLTPALAELLGLTGVQPIRWSFARAG
jgi:hypothetical protein